MLKVKELSKLYSENRGIKRLDLEVEPSDITLLLGPNGAGKTTAFRSILGLIDSDYKELTMKDQDVKDSMHQIGAMISKPVFYEYLTGYEHLKLFSQAYKNIDDYRIDEVLNIVGMITYKNEKIKTYSTGMKQRLDLARAILHSPKLLLLDEPFSGMDIEGKHSLKQVLKGLQSSEIGMVISSHMVGELQEIANKIVIVYEGSTLYSGTMDTIRKSGLTLEEFYLEKIDVYKKGA